MDRITVEGDTFDDDVHRAPTALDADQLAAVHEVVTAWPRTGPAAQRDARRGGSTNGRPQMLEIAVRPGGGGLAYFARLSAGYCPIRATMAVAAG